MGEIRAFSEEHLPEVADLYLRTILGRTYPATAALRDYFRDIFFQNPWASPDIAPLVYVENGAVVGFLGVIPRLMDFRGRSIRVATISQFMVERTRYRGPAAIQLLQRLFKGPQDLSYTDGAGEEPHTLWRACGGQGSYVYSFNWFRALRPIGAVRPFAERLSGVSRLVAQLALSAATPLDAVLARLPGPIRTPESPYASRRVTAEELLGFIAQVRWREPLRPAYDSASFPWLISRTAAARGRGELSTAGVFGPEGELCGWYIAYLPPYGAATVVQIGVRRSDRFDGVFAALLRDARARGAAAVKGLAMPEFLVNLSRHSCLFRQPCTRTLFHSRDADIAATIANGQAVLSGLEGERWLDFPGHADPAPRS